MCGSLTPRCDRQSLKSRYFLTRHRECCLAVVQLGQAEGVFSNIPRARNDVLCRRCFAPSVPKKLDLVPKIVASFGVAVRKRVCACGGYAMQSDTTTPTRRVYLKRVVEDVLRRYLADESRTNDASLRGRLHSDDGRNPNEP